MPESYFYEYAVIRLVPRVEREEFLNVGIIMFCKRPRFLKAKHHINTAKLSQFEHELELADIERNLEAFHKICIGSKPGGPMAQEDHVSRFRWLTAERSSSIQTSRPHHGFSADLDKTLERLFEELVM
ncbi:DUF3037 domain-containing protein [Owenweeksia hongkongensis]|uniref:DUF3037 domain-containing protein n=1 Tax=Owenweeksia hongkongensis TaxID=253245 RepID=UPI003A948A45